MKTRSDIWQIEKEMEWETVGNGVSRQIMGYDGQLMMVKVKFEKGGAVSYTHLVVEIAIYADECKAEHDNAPESGSDPVNSKKRNLHGSFDRFYKNLYHKQHEREQPNHEDVHIFPL